jgi:hypothetical protein
MFLKAKSTPSKSIHLLNQLGITMCFHWSTNAVKDHSKFELDSFTKHLNQGGRVLILYDNIRINFRKETQRVNNQTHGDNGTCLTAIKLPDAAANVFRNYRERDAIKQAEIRNLASYPHLTYEKLIIPEEAAYIRDYTIFQVINILLSSPDFEDYQFKDRLPSLQQPPPVHQLPTGKAHKTTYWQLGSWPIEESSYEGNRLVLNNLLKLMNCGPLSVEAETKVADGAIPIACDQLTFSLDWRMKLMRSKDRNSFDRLRWLLLSPGFFHVELNLANAILHNHRGTRASYGLARDISRLGVKGLASETDKPYFHTVDDLLSLECTARVRALWLWVSGASSLKDLRSRLNSPAEAASIFSMAERIVYERASTAALDDLEEAGQTQDPVLLQSIILARDVLFYNQLRETIRQGDVGHLEYLLPQLAIFFKGSGSKNYSQLILDYLQWSRFEAPEGVR